MTLPRRFTALTWGGVMLCAALSACSHSPKHPPSAPLGEHHASAPSITEWQGRMSLLVHSDPPQHLHASFILQGSPAQGSLSLNTPLGNVAAQAHWQPGSATLTQGGQTQSYASLDDMLRHTSLSSTPVTALFAWLQGQAIEAEGWQADLSQQASGRINANRQYPLPSAEIKIVVEQY